MGQMHTQSDISNGQYNYYAFVSYSRKDEKLAKWVQDAVETYRLPAAIRKSNVSIPAKIFPLFRDKTDLSGTKLKQALHQELEASRYLIVICSSNSAVSEYVDEEISYFIQLGRGHAIIPFIIEGEPYSDDPEKECFPPALRNLKEEQLGISVAELGWRGAFLRLISTLLNVRYDQVVMRDKRRRIRNAVLCGFAALLASAAIGATAWYNTPHDYYYNSMTYRYEVPVGIQKLSEQERSATSDCIKITMLRGRVDRVEIVNAEGTPISANNSVYKITRPVSVYFYDNSGRLTTIEEWDEYGQLATQKILTYNEEKNQIAIDFRRPLEGIHSQSLSANSLTLHAFDLSEENKSEVNRHLNQYDDEGNLIQITYEKDSYGTPACDSNGIYGLRLAYDQQGQVISVDNLDENGSIKNCKYGWATMEYTYDERGNLVSGQAYDSAHEKATVEDGYSCVVNEHDKNDNVIQTTYYDKYGNISYARNGVSIEKGSFDSHGHLISVRSFDAQGKPCIDLEAMVHELRAGYDENGRVNQMRFFSTDGNAMISEINGYSEVRMELDDFGRTLQWSFFDTEGKPCINPVVGYHIRRTEYENGIRTAEWYLDEDGMPTVCNLGYASYHTALDGAGNPVRTEYRDVYGNPTRSTEDIAVVERIYDHLGNWTEARYYDENGEPCNIVGGYARVKYSYENGNMVSESFYDVDGMPTKCSAWWHECRTEYDEKGNPIRYSFYNTQGELCRNSNNYAIQELDYDTHGNIIENRWYDPKGKPTGAPTTCREVYVYDESSNLIEEYYFSLTSVPLRYYAVSHEYAENGIRIGSTYFDEEGNPIDID